MMLSYQATLDVVGAALVGLTAMSIFGLHVYTSPARPHWFTLPNHVRFCMFMAALGLMIRSVNLTYIAEHPSLPGHLNHEAIFANFWMCATSVSLCILTVRHTFPPRVWERFRHVVRLAQCGHGKTNVKVDAVVELATAGAIVVGPGGSAQSFVEAVDYKSVRSEAADGVQKVMSR